MDTPEPLPTPPPAPPFITRAQRDVAAWAACFDVASLPIRRSTALALEAFRANEDAVDAHSLGEAIAGDPLMTLKLLAHVGQLQHRRGRESDAETAVSALVLMGIPPFFRQFGPQAAAEDWLAGRPAALEGFLAVLQRSRRAADFALGFAVHRMDHDASVIHAATLLHDLAELLLWLRAPDLALQIADRQRADPTLRSAEVQQELLNIRLPQLQHELMRRWRMPTLMVALTDDEQQAQKVQVRNVTLAVRLARHSALGWDNAALPDDLHDIAALLNLTVEPATRLVHEIDGT